MVQPFRPGRLRQLEAELEKKDGQLSEVRGALLRILTLSNTNDDLAYRLEQQEHATRSAHDQNRQLAAAVTRRFGVDVLENEGDPLGRVKGRRLDFSREELEQAYRDEPRLEAIDPESDGNRFFLNYSTPERELPPQPVPAPPPTDTTDTPAASGTAEDTAPSATSPDAGGPAEDKPEPLPS